MLTLAILATLGAIVWSGFTLMANSMSDSPSTGFVGLGTIILVWLGTIALWLGYILG